jgi:AGZA family xanthine/uracil permease-like MFS transporter
MFQLRERGTSLWTEVRGGLVTYLTLSYILFVQPAVLAATGMPTNDVFVATCVASAIACFLMALLANYPIALAPAMGHNFFFAFTVCGLVPLGMGFSWQEALFANFLAGAFFVAVSIFGLREAVMTAVPDGLKYAIAVGIGLLIAFVGLQYGGLVQNHPAMLVRLGDLRSPVALVVLAGVAIAAVLAARNVRGAILISILATAIIAWAVGKMEPRYYLPDGLEVITKAQHLERAGVTKGAANPVPAIPPADVRVVLAKPRDSGSWAGRIVSLPEAPRTTFAAIFRDPLALFRDHGPADVLLVMFIFFFLALFDTVGTLIGVSERAGLMDASGRLPRARQALLADAVGTVVGTIFGTSTITSYVESAAGVREGARTGLAAIVVGILLLASLAFAPLVEMIGGGAHLVQAGTAEELVQVVAGTPIEVRFYPVIAPVLIVIGVMMMGTVCRIKWEEYDEAIPAFLTIVVMQFSLSITDGIAWGFISYTLLKVVTGRARQLHWLVGLFAVLFLAQYVARAMLIGAA